MMKNALCRMAGRNKDQTQSDATQSLKSPDVVNWAAVSLNPPETAPNFSKDQKSGSEINAEKSAYKLTGGDLIQCIFSGAPQFSVQQTIDQYVPTIGFPWNTELEVRDASDCVAIQHPAFSACTTYSHLVPGHHPVKHAPEYAIGINETPNMLAATGKEPGTIGFVHFLEEPLSDAFEEGKEIAEAATQRASMDTLDSRDAMKSAPEKLGIRQFNIEVIGERLKELGSIYREYRSSNGKIHILKKESDGEMYTKLFTQLLMPPKFDPNANDPTGLKLQIEVLINILKMKDMWFDFSLVEWRIRIGAILWKEGVVEKEIETGKDESSTISDRHIAILQITLACELLLRLDAVAAVSVDELYDVLCLNSSHISDFEGLETRKTKWDLWLARYFLRNTDVKMTSKDKIVPATPSQSRNLPFFSKKADAETKTVSLPDIAFIPQNLELQLGGLFKFANSIAWPNADVVEKQLRSKLNTYGEDLSLVPTPETYSTPLVSPRSTINQRSTYFDARPQLSQRSTPHFFHLQSLSPALDETVTSNSYSNPIGGWLTRTYITGLILPGEALSHFLISALLENDATAIEKLGDTASLYGGFSYSGHSWWSKGSVVGRVMSALKGSKESMGWIYVPRAPEQTENTWIDIQCESVHWSGESRIKQIKSLKEDAAFVSVDKLVNSLAKVEAFSLPIDPKMKPKSRVVFEGLNLRPCNSEFNDSIKSGEALEPDISERLIPQLATLYFSSAQQKLVESPVMKFPLRYLVNFVSAYPCFPPKEVYSKVFPDAPSGFCGHALHGSRVYRIIPASELVSNLPFERNTVGSSADRSTDRSATESEESKEVVVLDARGDPTLDLFARAWCAWKGEHAIIGRVGTTCIACCVTEARFLGLRIVIRLG
jgi:hypothetical protein